jgi:ABC-type Zn uptake system ZnuABC Zn-binding protein ZnuA
VSVLSWLGLILSIITFALTVGACTDDSEASTDNVRVLTSLEIFADMARNVGGDRVQVVALLPSGADPHTFELRPSAVRKIAEADIIFINGLGLEGNLEDVIRENAEGPIVELAAGSATIDGNPHIWLGFPLDYVSRIEEALLNQDETHAQTYEANADRYFEEIIFQEGRVETAVATIPESNRKLVTFHDAFPYLAERYGLEIVAVVAPSPGQEPSAEDIGELTETIERENVPAVFTEPQFNSDVLDAAAEDADVRVLDLLSDAYIDGVDTYIELMEFNMEQLVEGLSE